MIKKTLINPTRNMHGHVIPAGTKVEAIELDFTDLAKCTSSEFGVFYTSSFNLE